MLSIDEQPPMTPGSPLHDEAADYGNDVTADDEEVQQCTKQLRFDESNVLHNRKSSSSPHLLRKDTMVVLTESVESRLKQQCSKSLDGSWVNPNGVLVRQISGGLSNYLYVVSLRDHVISKPGEIRKVLVRIYGEVLRSNLDSVVLDSVIFALISEKKLGPKLYGVFTGGRIEEFVESRPLTTAELRVPAISQRIASHFAIFHLLDMPLNKRPTFLFNTMDKCLRELTSPTLLRLLPTDNEVVGGSEASPAAGADAEDDDHDDDCLLVLRPTVPAVEEVVALYRLVEEVAWIRRLFLEECIGIFPIVFCHNDLQENNILYFEDATADHGFRLLPIDFEYCSYNFRGFDIGNHFNEWSFDYIVEEWPHFKFKPEDSPTREHQLDFWKTYLINIRDNNNPDTDSSGPIELSATEEEALLTESTYGALLSHLFWAIWSLIQSRLSAISFGFTEYAIRRLELYRQLKAQLPPLPRRSVSPEQRSV